MEKQYNKRILWGLLVAMTTIFFMPSLYCKNYIIPYFPKLQISKYSNSILMQTIYKNRIYIFKQNHAGKIIWGTAKLPKPMQRPRDIKIFQSIAHNQNKIAAKIKKRFESLATRKRGIIPDFPDFLMIKKDTAIFGYTIYKNQPFFAKKEIKNKTVIFKASQTHKPRYRIRDCKHLSIKLNKIYNQLDKKLKTKIDKVLKIQANK